jgi:predicted membrane channel-forming protein YqfA (hemolysin III family)
MTISRFDGQVFSIFIMLMMWGLTIAAIFLTLSVVTRGRKVEIGMFSFLAALLFALRRCATASPARHPLGRSAISFRSFGLVIIALCRLRLYSRLCVRRQVNNVIFISHIAGKVPH